MRTIQSETMLHVFYGNTTIGVRAKAYAFVSSFTEKGMKLSRVDENSYEAGVLRDAAGALSLFGEKTLYLLDTPSQSPEFYEDVMGMLQELHESDSVFVVIEGTLLAGQKKEFAKYADSLEEIREDTQRPFNVFALADSLSRKDKKSLWLGLCDAKQAGLSSEEIIGTLWWQLKTLRLASLTKNAEQAGMKDFPYNKAKRSLSYFKEGDLERLSQSLLALYHQGHQGETQIDLALEKWTLSI